MHTLQETFDKVVAHFKTMKGPAVMPDVRGCAYRGPNGNKCFAGALIDNSLYSEGMEGKTADSEMVGAVLKAEGYDVEFVQQLQSVHDRHAHLTGREWRMRVTYDLVSAAKDYDLSTAALD